MRPGRAHPVLGVLRHARGVHHAQEEQAKLHRLKVELGEQPAKRARVLQPRLCRPCVILPDKQAEAGQKRELRRRLKAESTHVMPMTRV